MSDAAKSFAFLRHPVVVAGGLVEIDAGEGFSGAVQVGFSADVSSHSGDFAQRLVDEDCVLEGFRIVVFHLFLHGVAVIRAADAGVLGQVSYGVIPVEPLEELAPAESFFDKGIPVGDPLVPAGFLADEFVHADAKPHFDLDGFGGASSGFEAQLFPQLCLNRGDFVHSCTLPFGDAGGSVKDCQVQGYVYELVAFRVLAAQDVFPDVVCADGDDLERQLGFQPLQMLVDLGRLPAGVGEYSVVRLGDPVFSHFRHENEGSGLYARAQAEDFQGLPVAEPAPLRDVFRLAHHPLFGLGDYLAYLLAPQRIEEGWACGPVEVFDYFPRSLGVYSLRGGHQCSHELGRN